MINISERLKGICSLLLRLDPTMSNLKLQKLLYFIQASSLIYLREPAFVDKIEAWQYGPVVPNAYNEYRFNFDNLIKHREIENKNLSELVHVIYKHLGKYTSFDLVNLTHSYSSWKDTWNKEVGGVISIHDIIICHVEIAKKKNGFVLYFKGGIYMKIILINKDYEGFTFYANKICYKNIQELINNSDVIINRNGDIIKNRFSNPNFPIFSEKNIECLKNMFQIKVYKSLDDII